MTSEILKDIFTFFWISIIFLGLSLVSEGDLKWWAALLLAFGASIAAIFRRRIGK